MSDLPSRNDQNQPWWENAADHLDETGRSEAADIIRAWWSSRLFDRRDIDWEAAGRQWVATIPYDVQYEWDDPQSVEIVKSILVAAIGDTDG